MAVAGLLSLVMAGAALSHVPFSHMSLKQVERYQVHVLKHDNDVIHYWKNRRVRVLLNARVDFPACRGLNAYMPHDVCFAYKQRVWVKRELAQTRAAISARERAAAANAFPAHHVLWTCIHQFEASTWSTRGPGGHDGGLQMTSGWMNEFSGSASEYSQVQQERFAEDAYQKSGYSTSFLYGQWFTWDGAAGTCLRYA